MLKGSSALNTLRWFDELVEEPFDRLDQKVLLRSGGEGCRAVRFTISLLLTDCLTGMNAPVSVISGGAS